MSCITANARALHVQPSQQPESTQSIARSKTQSYLCHKAHAPSCEPAVVKTHSRLPFCSLSSFLPAHEPHKIILQQQAAPGTQMHDCECAFLAKVSEHLLNVTHTVLSLQSGSCNCHHKLLVYQSFKTPGRHARHFSISTSLSSYLACFALSITTLLHCSFQWCLVSRG